MFWEFLKFWGGCIVTGWHIGDGIFGAVVEFCLLTSAGLFFLKHLFKKFNWKKLWKKWEEIVMKWAFILFLGSFLIAAVFVAPFLEYKKASQITEIHTIPKVIAKPLPDKIIPRPEPPPPLIVSTQQIVGIETQKSFEIFNPDTGAIGDATSPISKLMAENFAKIAKLKADNDAIKEAEKRKRELNIQKWWDVYLPYYNRSLIVLHDVLAGEAAKTGDGIAQSAGYFQCLPPTIDPKIGELKVAEIGLQKNTNIDFIITITALTDSDVRRLRISCGGCFLESWPSWGDKFIRDIHIDPDFDNEKEVPIEKANELIGDEIKDLVAARYYISSNTNKQNPKLP
jgi:hypothetical protein